MFTTETPIPVIDRRKILKTAVIIKQFISNSYLLWASTMKLVIKSEIMAALLNLYGTKSASYNQFSNNVLQLMLRSSFCTLHHSRTIHYDVTKIIETWSIDTWWSFIYFSTTQMKGSGIYTMNSWLAWIKISPNNILNKDRHIFNEN